MDGNQSPQLIIQDIAMNEQQILDYRRSEKVYLLQKMMKILSCLSTEK
ncbi:hypothetical protein ACVPOS_13705 [Staphylococcus aureus]